MDKKNFWYAQKTNFWHAQKTNIFNFRNHRRNKAGPDKSGWLRWHATSQSQGIMFCTFNFLIILSISTRYSPNGLPSFETYFGGPAKHIYTIINVKTFETVIVHRAYHTDTFKTNFYFDGIEYLYACVKHIRKKCFLLGSALLKLLAPGLTISKFSLLGLRFLTYLPIYSYLTYLTF